MLDLAYAVLLEQVENDARADRLALAFAGSDHTVEDSREHLDQVLNGEGSSSLMDPEQRELREALGLET